MRASDLLDREVCDARGRCIGRIVGMRASLDGPKQGSLAAPRITELVVTRHHVGTSLGYHQPGQTGPWLLRVALALLQRNTTIVPWTDVVDFRGERVLIR